MVCSLPSFIVAGLLFFLPESPKFLLSNGRHDEAMHVFRHIYSSNTGKEKKTYMVSSNFLKVLFFRMCLMYKLQNDNEYATTM